MAVLNKNFTLGVYSQLYSTVVYKVLYGKRLLTQLKSSFNSVVALGIGGGGRGWKNLPEVLYSLSPLSRITF